jgi:hypothetical protein
MSKIAKNGSLSEEEIAYLMSAESTPEICNKDIPPEDKELIHKMIEARENELSSKTKGHSIKGGR